MHILELAKILSLAAVLSRLSKNEPRNSLVALAWTIRNRQNIRQKIARPTRSGIVGLFYHDSISHAGRLVRVRSWNIFAFLRSGIDKNYCRSLAIASQVWSGEEADPTVGATRFHRHDDWPEWAEKSEPVALIGNWFFYNQGEMAE
jgi:hypothetical protein